MTVTDREYYRRRWVAERRLADSATHSEAKRRHAELAELYAELAGSRSAPTITIVTDEGGNAPGEGTPEGCCGWQ